MKTLILLVFQTLYAQVFKVQIISILVRVLHFLLGFWVTIILLVIVFSVLLAWVLHSFNQYLIGALSGKHKKNQLNQPDLLNEGKLAQNHSIDCFRMIACFLVVCIYIPFRGTMGALFISFGKIAVPFFLVVGVDFPEEKVSGTAGNGIEEGGSLCRLASLFVLLFLT